MTGLGVPRAPRVAPSISKEGLVGHFGAKKGAKGPSNCYFGIVFESFLKDFWRSGEIVKIELSLQRELNPEGNANFDVFFKTCPGPSSRVSQSSLLFPPRGRKWFKVISKGFLGFPKEVKILFHPCPPLPRCCPGALLGFGRLAWASKTSCLSNYGLIWELSLVRKVVKFCTTVLDRWEWDSL